MQRLIVKIGLVAPEHVNVGADGENDTHDDTEFDVLQRCQLSAMDAHGGKEPSIGRGQCDEPVGHSSSAEDDESAEFTDRIDGDRRVVVPTGHDARGEADRDRDEIGERRREKEHGARVRAKSPLREDEAVENVPNHAEEKDDR